MGILERRSMYKTGLHAHTQAERDFANAVAVSGSHCIEM
jgi:hypothetical protein